MLAFLIRRLFQSVVVLLVVGAVSFGMFRFIGDPVNNMLGQERTQADIEELRERLGLIGRFSCNTRFSCEMPCRAILA